MRGDGMNQDYAQNMMQPPYGQVPQNDPYAAYRPMGNTGAYQAPQYPVYPHNLLTYQYFLSFFFFGHTVRRTVS